MQMWILCTAVWICEEGEEIALEREDLEVGAD